MANLIIADLKAKTRTAKKRDSVRTKRMRRSDGKIVSVLSLDANSTTFIDDLTTVFEKNVSKARKRKQEIAWFAGWITSS
jgi:hypothetical protein